MVIKEKSISVNELADKLHIHRNTLNTWLCHWSMAKYTFKEFHIRCEYNMLKLTPEAIYAFRRLLVKKKKKYLIDFDIFVSDNHLL